MRLTTFSRYLLSAVAFCILFYFILLVIGQCASCSNNYKTIQHTTTQTVQTPQYEHVTHNGVPTVIVHDKDMGDYMMEAVLWNHILNSNNNNYGAVRNYHHYHYNNTPSYRSTYSNNFNSYTRSNPTYKPYVPSKPYTPPAPPSTKSSWWSRNTTSTTSTPVNKSINSNSRITPTSPSRTSTPSSGARSGFGRSSGSRSMGG